MVKLFGGSEQRKGRGLQIQLSIFPSLSPEVSNQFMNIFTPESKLPQYFGNLTANFTSNVKDQIGGAQVLRIVITCSDAKFELKPSDAERYYTDLFYYIFGVLESVVNKFRATRMVEWAGIREFGEVITFRPKENPESLVPIFPMKEIWSRLYVRDFFSLYSNNREKLANLLRSKEKVLSKDDAKLIEQIVTVQKDYREFISKHADQIISLDQKLGGGESWEAGFKRDGGQQIKAGIDAALRSSSSNKVVFAPMPTSEGDASAIREISSKILSA